MFWGFSESLDLVSEYTQANPPTTDGDSQQHLNILLFGNGDPRHILKTIAKSYKHKTTLNFYIVDGCIEIVARNMLLMAIALENPESLSLRAKTHLFMDVYGNALLRPASNNYVISKSKELTKVVTDSSYLEEKMSIFDIEGLKFRERDGLENAFHFWLPREEHVFNIKEYWEQRNRSKLGVRYDHRHGAFDWDLQMRLKDSGGKQICSQEYRHWRDTGIAFTFPEYEQSKANKTLAAGLVRNGRHYRHRGFLGDIEVGPFCSFGLKADDPSLMKSAHGDNDYRSTDVTDRNLLEIFFEIQEKQPFDSDSEKFRKLGGTILDLGQVLPTSNVQNIELQQFADPILHMSNAKLKFLSMDDILTMQEGAKYQNMFDVVFIGSNYFEFLKQPFCRMFAENALVLFETKELSVLTKENCCAFLQRIKDFAKDANLTALTKFNLNLNYSIVKYKKEN